MKKILITVVILFVAAVGGWLLVDPGVNNSDVNKVSTTTNATSSKAELKTYTNAEYGYSFQYPEDWYVYDSNNGGSDQQKAVVLYPREFPNPVVAAKTRRGINITTKNNIMSWDDLKESHETKTAIGLEITPTSTPYYSGAIISTPSEHGYHKLFVFGDKNTYTITDQNSPEPKDSEVFNLITESFRPS